MSFRSTIARPTFTPALNVFSTTCPVFTLRSFDRTNAPPLPGFTCWNSTICHSTPSRSRVIPFLKSFVETLTAAASSSEFDGFFGGGRDHAAPVGRDLDRVLDTNPTETGDVDTWLDRHDGALRDHVVDRACEARTLVDLEAHTVAQAVREALAVP